MGSCTFLAPFFQSRHLSNGDLRMRAHRIVYHIIVLLSWFWVGILRSPRSSILWFSPTTDVIFQVLPAFWTHFAFFLGCWFLVRFHRSIEIWPHLSLIRRFYFHHGFGMFWLGIFRGMRSSTVNLECRHWFCDIDEGCHFWVSYPNFWQFTNIFGPIAIYSNVFSKAFTFIFYIYGNYI